MYGMKRSAARHHQQFVSAGLQDEQYLARHGARAARLCGAATRNRFRGTLSAFFNWLVREGLLDTNCVTGTGKAVEGAPRSRVLSDAELRTLWARLTQDQWG